MIDKAKMEAYDKIKMPSKGDGVVARWVADAFGFGLAEQVTRLMTPQKEEDLADHVGRCGRTR